MLLSYEGLLTEGLVRDSAGFLYVCPVELRVVELVVALLEVVVLLPTAARVDEVLLVPNDDLVVVEVLRPVETAPDVNLFVLAKVLLDIVSCRLPL